MLFASGNAQEPMAMAEVFIRKATLLRAKEKCHSACAEMLSNQLCSLLQISHRVLLIAQNY